MFYLANLFSYGRLLCESVVCIVLVLAALEKCTRAAGCAASSANYITRALVKGPKLRTPPVAPRDRWGSLKKSSSFKLRAPSMG